MAIVCNVLNSLSGSENLHVKAQIMKSHLCYPQFTQ